MIFNVLRAKIHCKMWNFLNAAPGIFSKRLQSQYERAAANTGVPDGFTVTCHSGALGTMQNSISSVKTALEWGARVIEVDVSFRPDGEAVIIHNSTPMQYQGTEFESVLKQVKMYPECSMNLDLKAFWNVAEIDRLVEKYQLSDRVFYTGVSRKQVREVSHGSVIPYFLNEQPDIKRLDDREYAQQLSDDIKQLGAVGLNCQYKHISRIITDVLHENGLKVSVWTVNSRQSQCEMLSFGVDNITTLKPEALYKYVLKSGSEGLK
ncbi:MAG: glycerophosphodiester phosphodiesterase [Clostridiales bacterium]|nr:glycerophosphodiester phosphodiesterase [Clostridiales bacterium]